MIILLREITVSGLREFLAGLQVSVPVSRLAKWKTAFQMIALGALLLAGALKGWPWIHDVGLACLWAAAMLTLLTERKSTSLNPDTNAQLVCRLLIEKKTIN